jgi:hypothetical protein
MTFIRTGCVESPDKKIYCASFSLKSCFILETDVIGQSMNDLPNFYRTGGNVWCNVARSARKYFIFLSIGLKFKFRKAEEKKGEIIIYIFFFLTEITRRMVRFNCRVTTDG